MGSVLDNYLKGSSEGIATGQELKPEPSPLQQFLANSPATTAIRSTEGVNPDQAAKQQELSAQTGLPLEAVEAAPSPVERYLYEQETQRQLYQSPWAQAFLSDRRNAAIARDDVKTLVDAEAAVKEYPFPRVPTPVELISSLFDSTTDEVDLARGVGEGVAQVPGMILSGSATLLEAGARSVNAPIFMALRALGMEDVERELKNIDAGMPWWLSPTGILAYSGEGWKRIATDIGPAEEDKNLATEVAGGVGQVVAQATAAVLSGGLSTLGSWAMLFAQGADQQKEMMEEAGVTPGSVESDLATFGGAIVTGLTERFGLDLLFNKIPSAVRTRIGRALAGLGTEGAQEAIEGIWQNVVGVTLYDPTIEIFEGVEDNATVGGLTGFIVNAVIPGRQAALHRKTLDQLAKIMEQSALANRAPDRAASYVGTLLENAGIPDASINVAKVDEVLGDRAQDFFEQAGVAAEANEARLTGGEVIVDRDTIGRLVIGDDFEALADHVRFGPDAMTAEEAKAQTDTGLAEQIDKLREQAQRARGELEDEVTLAEEQLGLQAMFKTADEAGMTPAQYETYLVAVAQAAEAGRKRQEMAQIRQQQRELTAEWKAEEQKVRKELTERMGQTPLYGAIDDVTEGEWARDRLDREAVLDIFDGDIASLDKLPRGKNGRRIYVAKDGLNPEELAEKYGFAGADVMLFQMIDQPSKSEMIERETQREMYRRHGDLRNRAQALNQAMESLHNDQQEALLAAEMNALREAVGAKRLSAKLLRKAAIDSMSKIKVKDLNWRRFMQESARKGREAGKALRKGNRQLAAQLKFQQVIQFQMAKEAIARRDRMAKQLRYLRKFARKKQKWENIDANFVDQIKNILSRFALHPRRNPARTPSLSEFSKNAVRDGAILSTDVVNFETGQRDFRGLTLRQFDALHRAIKNIERQGRAAKKITLGKEELDRKETVERLVKKTEALPELKRQQRQRVQQEPGLADRTRKFLAGLDAAVRKVEFLLQDLDGGQPAGPWHEAFFQPSAVAQRQQATLLREIFEPVFRTLEDLPADVRRNWQKKIYIPELNRSFTRANLVMMALNIGNESNYDKMIRGSEVDNEATPWTREGVEAALTHLTPAEWKWVQMTWDSYQTLFPLVKEIYRKEFGIEPEEIEARSFTTANGVKMRGGYFPIMYDYNRMKNPPKDTEPDNALDAMQSEHIQATVFSGMTKARTRYRAPVSLSFESAARGAHRLSHYISHYEFVRSTMRLLSDPKIRAAVSNKMGPEYYREMKDWLSALATDGMTPSQDMREFDSIAAWMRSSVTAATLALSYTTMVAQTFGTAQTVAVLGQDLETGKFSNARGVHWASVGVGKYLANPAAAIELAFRLSDEMPDRLNSVDREIKHAMDYASRHKNILTEAQRLALIGVGGIQMYAVDLPAWIGGFNQALAAGRTEQQAAKHADSVVRRSQGSGHLKDLSKLQRQKGIMRWLTMFSTFAYTNYNLQRQALKREGGPRSVTGGISRMMWLVAIPALWEAAMRADAPDDEDKVPLGWWLTRTIGYSLMSVPIVGPALDSAAHGFKPTLSPVESAGQPITTILTDVARGEIDWDTAKAAFGFVGRVIGIPGTVQIERVIRTIEAGDRAEIYDFLLGYREDR